MHRIAFVVSLLVTACHSPSEDLCAPAPIPTSWTEAITTAGTARLRVPPGYRKDGARDEWLSDQRRPDARSLAVVVSTPADHERARRLAAVVPPLPDPWDIAPTDTATCDHCGRITDRIECQRTDHGRPFVLRAGLLTVANGGPQRSYVLSVRRASTGADSLAVYGRAATRAGLEELVTMALTIEPAP